MAEMALAGNTNYLRFFVIRIHHFTENVHAHVRITFPYHWGCEEELTLTLGPGMQARPGVGTFDDCRYAYDWPCLDYYEPKPCVVGRDLCSCDGVDLGRLFGQGLQI